MMPKSIAWILVLLALLPGIAHSADVTVKVTGMGATRTEALEDATRQAVQLALEQLVITDRKIVNDEIIRDETISTLNGFIKKRQILATRKVDGQVEIDAKITVSRKQVTNYIGDISQGSNNQSGSTIDGSTLGSEIERQRSAAKISNALIQRLMRGVPLNAVSVTIRSVRVSKRNKDYLEIVADVAFKKGFLDALSRTVKAIAVSRLKMSQGGYFNPLDKGNIVNSWDNDPSDWWFGGGPLQMQESAKGFSVCFSARGKDLQHRADCYILHDTPDLAGLNTPYAPTLSMSFGAMSDDGSILECLRGITQNNTTLPLRVFSADDYARSRGYQGGLLIGTDVKTITFLADISGKDLSNMTTLKAFPGLAAGTNGGTAYLMNSRDRGEAVIYDLSRMKASPPCYPN